MLIKKQVRIDFEEHLADTIYRVLGDRPLPTAYTVGQNALGRPTLKPSFSNAANRLISDQIARQLRVSPGFQGMSHAKRTRMLGKVATTAINKIYGRKRPVQKMLGKNMTGAQRGVSLNTLIDISVHGALQRHGLAPSDDVIHRLMLERTRTRNAA